MSRFGLIGYGRIGRRLAERMKGSEPALAAVLVRPIDRARAENDLGPGVVCTEIDALMDRRPDIVVECASGEALRLLGPRVLANGIDLVPLSLAALADPATERLFADTLAGPGHGRIEVAAGAMASLDALAAAREDDLRRVLVRVAYPASRLRGTPAESGLDLMALTAPRIVASGSARALARAFPRHLNVVVGVGLAGLGLDETRAELVADPGLTQATFTIEAEAGPGALRIDVRGRDVPLGTDPIDYTTFSVLRLLRRRVARIAI